MPGSTTSAKAPRAGKPANRSPAQLSPTTVEGWLHDLGLEPGEGLEREGIVAWDVALDGRRRRDLRATLILDPAIGAIVWAHLAPPLGDGLRKAYRTLLRWNDEFPLAKFSVADDGRPILADAIFEETRGWLWIGGRVPDDYEGRPVRTAALLDRFSGQLGELAGG